MSAVSKIVYLKHHTLYLGGYSVVSSKITLK
nr:MAG TPA: hypothetical protein [Caudoviricetes sp.]